MKIFRTFQSSGRLLLNLLFPNKCHFCDAALKDGCCICSECLEDIEVIGENICTRCGAQLTGHTELNSHHCYQCRDLGFSFRKNESIGIFSGRLRKLIHSFKFEGRRSLFKTFTALSIVHKGSYIRSHDICIPVPLSRSRYLERGFNQSYLIAKAICKKIPVLFLGHSVVRKGRSSPQSSISSLKERLENLTDQFIVRKKAKGLVKDRNILLIDDVLTTGATASACARVLFDEGAKNVDLLTMARAVKLHSA